MADLDMQRSSDRAIWDYALASGPTIVTKDEDFAQRKVLSGDGPIVIWIRLPNTSRQALFAWFERVWPDLLMAVERGESLIEVI